MKRLLTGVLVVAGAAVFIVVCVLSTHVEEVFKEADGRGYQLLKYALLLLPVVGLTLTAAIRRRRKRLATQIEFWLFYIETLPLVLLTLIGVYLVTERVAGLSRLASVGVCLGFLAASAGVTVSLWQLEKKRSVSR